MWLCRTHLQEEDERERERAWQRDGGGCVPRWERKTQQALSRRTKEISNVWRPIVPIKEDRSGIIWRAPIISIDCQIHPWSSKAMFSGNIFTMASRKKWTNTLFILSENEIFDEAFRAWMSGNTRLLYVMTERPQWSGRTASSWCLRHYGPLVDHMHNMLQLQPTASHYPKWTCMNNTGPLFAHCCWALCEFSVNALPVLSCLSICSVQGRWCSSIYLPTRRNQGKRS